MLHSLQTAGKTRTGSSESSHAHAIRDGAVARFPPETVSESCPPSRRTSTRTLTGSVSPSAGWVCRHASRSYRSTWRMRSSRLHSASRADDVLVSCRPRVPTGPLGLVRVHPSPSRPANSRRVRTCRAITCDPDGEIPILDRGRAQVSVGHRRPFGPQFACSPDPLSSSLARHRACRIQRASGRHRTCSRPAQMRAS